jgi:hypothetical protein
MEAHRKVLKYFDELSMNCITAIKRYPVVGPDTASSTSGADFIGSRELTALVMYDENVKRRSRNMQFQTVQTSKNTQVSVMAMRIQLIHVETGTIKSLRKMNIS